jgi:hypothetical protein
MNHPKHHDPANKARPFMEEADIGSGEKNPGQLETEEMIREIPPLPHPNQQADQAGAQQGNRGSQSPASPDSPSNRQAVKP